MFPRNEEVGGGRESLFIFLIVGEKNLADEFLHVKLVKLAI